VKVCGITCREDALLAAELGAWAVGFIFYAPSPRSIRPEDVPAITEVLGDAVEKVGVFVDAGFDVVLQTAGQCGLTIAQLHGNEEPSFAEALKPHFRDVWKAVRVGASLPASQLEFYRGWTILLDTLAQDRPGGTGATFPWDLAREARAYGRIVLAGGLNPDNVAQAVRMVEPFAVDVASGVEACPGKKDHDRLRSFFRAVRGAS
jgi:phosphoribosylanthranilate isomerase